MRIETIINSELGADLGHNFMHGHHYVAILFNRDVKAYLQVRAFLSKSHCGSLIFHFFLCRPACLYRPWPTGFSPLIDLSFLCVLCICFCFRASIDLSLQPECRTSWILYLIENPLLYKKEPSFQNLQQGLPAEER